MMDGPTSAFDRTDRACRDKAQQESARWWAGVGGGPRLPGWDEAARTALSQALPRWGSPDVKIRRSNAGVQDHTGTSH